jgi:hypothetical protein
MAEDTGSRDAGQVAHCDPALRCADDAADIPDPDTRDPVPGPSMDPAPGGDAAAAADDLAAFASGLLASWPPAGDVPVVRLAPHAPQVARPDMGPNAPTCLVCGHTFRPGEHVVVCPCGMHRESCVAAVHRDPVAGLSCWDDWQPGGILTRCPVTLKRVDR